MKPFWGKLSVGMLLGGMMFLPLVVESSFLLHVLILSFMWAILAASWDLLSGYTGQISFGHAGFFAMGAYAASMGSLHLAISPWMGLVVAGLLAGIMGLVIGIPTLRLRGHYLAIVTLGFSEIFRLVVHNWVSLTGGPFGIHGYPTFSGLPTDPARERLYFYYIVLGLLLLCSITMYILCEWTRIGEAFKAIREDEILASALGINTTIFKVTAFTISAFFAGIAGGIYAYYVQLVSPWTASTYVTVLVIGMAVFGGLGTIVGPILGALVLNGLYEYMRFLGVVYNLIMVGAVIMAFVIFLPKGIMGLLKGKNPSVWSSP